MVVRDDHLEPVLNLLNSVIYDFRRRNPSIGDTDVLLSLRRLRLFLKRKDILLTSLADELFNGVVGISSLAGLGRPKIIAAIDYLEKMVGEYSRTGRSYLDSMIFPEVLVQDSKVNN